MNDEKMTSDEVFEPGMAFLAAGVAAAVGIVPLLGYGIAMIATGQHIVSIIAQAAMVAIVVLVVLRFVPRLLKD